MAARVVVRVSDRVRGEWARRGVEAEDRSASAVAIDAGAAWTAATAMIGSRVARAP